MAGSKLGTLFSITTFGESHGPFIGVVIDGVRPGIPIDEAELQKQMSRRRPGQSALTTPRNEADQAEIISGVFGGKTTGTPLCILIRNSDQRSRDYDALKDVFRPGHAAYTFLKKYGIFDYRGGGRASGRETATRVAAGAIARQILKSRQVEFYGFTRQIGPHIAATVDYAEIENNPVRCPDRLAAAQMEACIRQVADEGDSIGGVVEVHILGLPAGLGDPVFEKLEAELAHALMSIGAVKGVEFGSGFRVAEMRGSENNDLFTVAGGEVIPATNHAGGTLGGISTGQAVVVRLAVKPPSSIRKPQRTVDRFGKEQVLSVEGRHDPCICPRVVPVAEAMAALVILDLLLMQDEIRQDDGREDLRRRLTLTDAQLLLLLRHRMELSRQVGGVGEDEFSLTETAAELGLPENFVRSLWQQIQRGTPATIEGEGENG